LAVTRREGEWAERGAHLHWRLIEPEYQAILEELLRSERIAADETGWRSGGNPVWLHAWVGDRATCYVIDPCRSAVVS
jgi:transposase